MDMQEAKMTEVNSQKDYEQAMKDAANKREKDSKSIVTKEGERAEVTTKLEATREGKSTKESQLGDANDKLNELHQSCLIRACACSITLIRKKLWQTRPKHRSTAMTSFKFDGKQKKIRFGTSPQ